MKEKIKINPEWIAYKEIGMPIIPWTICMIGIIIFFIYYFTAVGFTIYNAYNNQYNQQVIGDNR